jgi:dihydroorotate dehydrogenase (NAD+) catalytic subunit
MPKRDLHFNPPLMNAAGILGFAPDPKSPLDFARFGAFVTHPVSRFPRTPARGTRFVPFSGGFLLHTGLPNPGLDAVIRRHARRWVKSPLPVIVHLLARDTASLREMAARLEETEGVAGLEIGLPPDVNASEVAAFARAAAGELPLIVRLPLVQADALADAALDAGAQAVSLGQPRGLLNGVGGRLYGPGIFPLALGVVDKLAGSGVPVIGGGGVYHIRDADAMLEAGALAVQVGGALWKGGFPPDCA